MSIATDLLARGATRLAVGIYDLAGEVHVDADEVCAHYGVEPTPANFEVIVAAALEVTDERTELHIQGRLS